MTFRAERRNGPLTQVPRTLVHFGDPWFETLFELHLGDFPSTPALVFGLRSGSIVPPEVREFLAQFVSQEIKRPKGRPKRPALDTEVTGEYVRLTYEMWVEHLTAERKRGEHFAGTVSETALEKTQEWLLEKSGEDLSEDTIRDILDKRHGWERRSPL